MDADVREVVICDLFELESGRGVDSRVLGGYEGT